MTNQDRVYQSYLLRLWRDTPARSWFFELESIQTGRKIHFQSLVQLCEYIQINTPALGNQMPPEEPHEQ